MFKSRQKTIYRSGLRGGGGGGGGVGNWDLEFVESTARKGGEGQEQRRNLIFVGVFWGWG